MNRYPVCGQPMTCTTLGHLEVVRCANCEFEAAGTYLPEPSPPDGPDVVLYVRWAGPQVTTSELMALLRLVPALSSVGVAALRDIVRNSEGAIVETAPEVTVRGK